MSVECLSCHGEIVVEVVPMVGDPLACNDCGDAFEVVEVVPFSIDVMDEGVAY